MVTERGIYLQYILYHLYHSASKIIYSIRMCTSRPRRVLSPICDYTCDKRYIPTTMVQTSLGPGPRYVESNMSTLLVITESLTQHAPRSRDSSDRNPPRAVRRAHARAWRTSTIHHTETRPRGKYMAHPRQPWALGLAQHRARPPSLGVLRAQRSADGATAACASAP